MKSLFNDLFTKLGYKKDYIYDWTIITEKKKNNISRLLNQGIAKKVDEVKQIPQDKKLEKEN